MKTAYFGAGCFWHAERDFSQHNGVINTEVGYCTYTPKINNKKEKSAKVEVVRVEYDPTKTDFGNLIDYFWTTHNITSDKNINPNYIEKSVIFAISDDQLKLAKEKLQRKKEEDKDIRTEINTFDKYTKAPEKDQQYYNKRQQLKTS